MKTDAPSQKGFSYIELVVAVAMIALLATLVVRHYNDYNKSVSAAKLEKDVMTLNAAVDAYLTNGGNLDGVTDLQAVLKKLKTKAASIQEAEIVGLKGAFIDSRLKAVLQTEEEAAVSGPRVVWMPVRKRFEIEDRGARGVREFVLDDSLFGEPEEETREARIKFGTEDKWVWDYKDAAKPPRASFRDVALGSVTPPIPERGRPDANAPLLPPAFQPPGGKYPLADFDLVLKLSNPNPASVSRVMFSVNGSDLQLYHPSGIQVSPDTTISACAISIDADRWTDSPMVDETYEAAPVELAVNFTVPQLVVNYGEVGGAMFPGSALGLAPLAPGMVTLANAGQIPLPFQNHSVFSLRWTYDGSDPDASATAETSAPFSGGFPGQAIHYALPLWGDRTVLPIQVMAKSLNPSLVTDSTVATQVLRATPIQLSAPVVTVTGTDVSLNLVTDSGNMPVGARVYFTVDGLEPGDIAGVPTSGSPYNGPFPSALAVGKPIKARTFAPEGYEQWFIASGVATFQSPDDPDDPGLDGGHIDVDTSSFIAGVGNGKTDAHVHQYDDKFDVTVVDLFNPLGGKLQGIDDVVSNSSQTFKIIVANADLSPAAILVINESNDLKQPGRHVSATTWDDTSLEDLPVFRLGGGNNDRFERLRSLELRFAGDAIKSGGIIPTNTGDVRANVPGKNGEWRNGALTIQVVAVNRDGTDGFTTDRGKSAGGVQGVATSGLLWEMTVFHHWHGPSYHEAGNSFVPGQPLVDP